LDGDGLFAAIAPKTVNHSEIWIADVRFRGTQSLVQHELEVPLIGRASIHELSKQMDVATIADNRFCRWVVCISLDMHALHQSRKNAQLLETP
jgi:hypothetical protein